MRTILKMMVDESFLNGKSVFLNFTNIEKESESVATLQRPTGHAEKRTKHVWLWCRSELSLLKVPCRTTSSKVNFDGTTQTGPWVEATMGVDDAHCWRLSVTVARNARKQKQKQKKRRRKGYLRAPSHTWPWGTTCWSRRCAGKRPLSVVEDYVHRRSRLSAVCPRAPYLSPETPTVTRSRPTRKLLLLPTSFFF